MQQYGNQYLSDWHYQPRRKITRLEAEYMFQQMHGPVIGIERATDELLLKDYPAQYEIVR